MSSSTIAKAVREVRAGVEPSDRQRAPGGGDRPAIDKQPGLLEVGFPRDRGGFLIGVAASQTVL